MQSSCVVFPSPQLRKLRCALHSDNARSLRLLRIFLRLATARECAPRFYGSVRAVKVLLATLRSTVDCAPSAQEKVAMDSREEIVATVKRSGNVQFDRGDARNMRVMERKRDFGKSPSRHCHHVGGEQDPQRIRLGQERSRSRLPPIWEILLRRC